MKHILRVILIVSVLAVSVTGILLLSCTERTSNVTNSPVDKGGKGTQAHVFYHELQLQINNPFQLMAVSVYLPSTHIHGSPSGPIPLVILLPPQGADQNYYFDHGLQQVADELISNGTIEPMAIACINNAPILGGVFAGGASPAAGLYDELMADTLLGYLNKFYPGYFKSAASQHGIGGVGLGAYGAIRAAILNPDKYTSVTVTDGPLDFDGTTGNDGLFPLFNQALTEQGLWGDNQYLTKFDSGNGSGTWDASKLLLAAAISFSPHDTSATAYTRIIDRSPAGPGPEDEIRVDSVCTDKILDGGTLIHVFTQSYRTCGGSSYNFGDMHLPFTYQGNLYPLIWNNFWLPNSPDHVLAAHATALNNTKLWFGTSTESTLRFYQMTQSFIATAKGAPYNLTNNITEFQYHGTPDLPATEGQYTYDLLKEMLIFHNKHFIE